MNKALCVGINNYPNSYNNLRGCVNDANDWAKRLESFGFEVELLLDDQATEDNILDKFEELVSLEHSHVVFTYSGHGTQVRDTGGDELDGYDEALYVYGGIIQDDQLRTRLDNMHSTTKMTIVLDSCFSGTATRAPMLEESTEITPRFVPVEIMPVNARRVKALLSDEDMVEVLISGCSDNEYSYDAYINDRWNGAMTAYALYVLTKDQTYNEFYARLRELLPSTRYPQTPQLEGNSINKNEIVFFKVYTPEPEPEPEPSFNIWRWFDKYLKWVILGVIISVVIIYYLTK